jgi:hypothetical protein
MKFSRRYYPKLFDELDMRAVGVAALSDTSTQRVADFLTLTSQQTSAITE